MNFERKKKAKKPTNPINSTKKGNETPELNKDPLQQTSTPKAVSQFQASLFGFLKEESCKNKENTMEIEGQTVKESMEIEVPLSENKENEENEEETNKKNENNTNNMNIPGNISKKFNKTKRNNLLYYFKYPELLLLFYKFLKISIQIEEQTNLKAYLCEIYVKISKFNKKFKFFKSFMEKTGNFINNSPQRPLSELTNLTKMGQSFNCYLFELSYLNCLEKWAYSWLNISRNVLINKKINYFIKFFF